MKKSRPLGSVCTCVAGVLLSNAVWADMVTVTSPTLVNTFVVDYFTDSDSSSDTSIPQNTTLIASAGNSSNTTKISFSGNDNYNLFRYDFSHSINNTVGETRFTDNTETAGNLSFVAASNAPYTIDGYYGMTGPAGNTEFRVSLIDITAGSLFFDFSRSVNTANELFILGVSGDGDYSNTTTGSLTGNLIAGHTYQLLFGAIIETSADFTPTQVAATAYGEINLLIGAPGSVDLSGSIRTDDGIDICAMVLASGQFMFSCDPIGALSLTDLPRENNGTVKRQIYADGFFPKIDIMTDSTDESVVMTRSGACPDYNMLASPGFFPNSAGKWINISGQVLVGEDQQTPICAMVLANGQYMFSCDVAGYYDLNVPLDNNGQVKLQVYADGFAPTILYFDEFNANNDVKMARATECQ